MLSDVYLALGEGQREVGATSDRGDLGEAGQLYRDSAALSPAQAELATPALTPAQHSTSLC